ncbi:MAG: hypothetical protein J6M55_01115 [Paludibacteraceae bacterium]|nr:hypothetical protein [Paludibacteraceae bacterium]
MKRGILIAFLVLMTGSVCARPQKRAVVIDTVCNAPLHEMRAVASRFCYQFQACPDSLFEWAYLGLGEEEVKPSSKESRDVIQLRYKDRVYDPEHKTGDVAIDIYVLGIRWWKDQHLGSKYRLTRPANAQYPLTAHMTATYSGSILEGGDFILRMEPLSENQTRVHYEFRLVFGKVLSAFVSDKMWHNAIEWRFETILENLVECAETGTVQPKRRGPK